MAILETKNLTYTYSAGTPFAHDAITNVNIDIHEGELLGLIGHTGSGKSTLVQHLNGLIRPTSGSVILNGKDIWQDPKNIRSIRFQVGMVFQYPEHQLFEETVYKDIAFGPKNMGLEENEIKNRVYKACEFVGLDPSFLERSPFDLSGGEQRRVAIAGVVAMNPSVIIFDEPTAGLDPKGRDQLLSQIKKYHAETKNTMIFVSHSMEDVAALCDRVLVMNHGNVFMLAPTDEVFAHAEELEKVGLQVPMVTQVFMKLKKAGYPVKDNVYSIEQAKAEIARILSLKKGATV